ncbi:MAG: hypothetical protein N2322_00630, partial [Terrimicrobiaceae bacterium]|nr:hypothetical protein [Terrimicrobiaceae bacterium]
MKSLQLPAGWAALAASLALISCQSVPPPAPDQYELAIKNFEFKGLRIGGPDTPIIQFTQVQKAPSPNPDIVIYDIFNPAPQVSRALATFHRGQLHRLELRYFDGQGIRTLSKAGGWVGIRDYLMARYGPPSRFGPDVPLATSQPGLDPRYAKFNGLWLFTRAQRQLNYVAMYGRGSGVAIVTIANSNPLPTPKSTPTPIPNPTPGP